MVLEAGFLTSSERYQHMSKEPYTTVTESYIQAYPAIHACQEDVTHT